MCPLFGKVCPLFGDTVPAIRCAVSAIWVLRVIQRVQEGSAEVPRSVPAIALRKAEARKTRQKITGT